MRFHDPPHDAGTEQRGRPVFHGDSQYTADGGSGWLLFVLPSTGDATDARLEWPGGAWRPDEALRRRLAAPSPPFSVSVSFPDEIAVGTVPGVDLTVTNDGDLPGRFVAGLNRSGPQIAYRPVARISVYVPAGETVTHRVTDDVLFPMKAEDVGDGEPDLTYYLHWEHGETQTDVRLV